MTEELLMSDLCSNTLLPANRTKLETDIEQVNAQKYCDLRPEIIKELGDPQKCPLELLAWLAYAYSVDVWRDSWPESTKRAMVANAIEIHKYKGTVGGFEKALEVIGINIELVEWFNQDPIGRPGTIELTLHLGDNFDPNAAVMLGSEAIGDILKIINLSKRHSIHYAFRISMESTTGVGVASSLQINRLDYVGLCINKIGANAKPAKFSYGSSAQGLTHTQVNAENRFTTIETKASHFKSASSAQINQRIMVSAHNHQVSINTDTTRFCTASSLQLTASKTLNACHTHTAINMNNPMQVGISHSTQLNTACKLWAQHQTTQLASDVVRIRVAGSMQCNSKISLTADHKKVDLLAQTLTIPKFLSFNASGVLHQHVNASSQQIKAVSQTNIKLAPTVQAVSHSRLLTSKKEMTLTPQDTEIPLHSGLGVQLLTKAKLSVLGRFVHTNPIDTSLSIGASMQCNSQTRLTATHKKVDLLAQTLTIPKFLSFNVSGLLHQRVTTNSRLKAVTETNIKMGASLQSNCRFNLELIL
jgi:phage tail P2-like protein